MKTAKDHAGRILAGASVAAVFAYFAWIVVPGLVGEHGASGRSTPSAETVRGLTGWLDPAEAPPHKGRVLPAVDPASVMTPDPRLLERGRAAFAANCTACHGEQGRGDGPAASGLSPRPRDFASPSGWKNGYRLTDVYGTIRTGVRGTSMAAFDYLPMTDRMALAHYVRSLGKFDHGAEDAAALDALRAEIGTTGGRIPSRIPVSLAITKLAQEAPPARHLPVHSFVWDAERAGRTVAGLSAPLDPAALAAGAPTNGFRSEIATLNAEEWRLLLSALSKERER